jgi:hypothetical protein
LRTRHVLRSKMSMSVRSHRQTSMEQASTPAAVGPGAYTGHDRKVVAPSYAAFSSTNERNMSSNEGTSSMTPGPGAYSKSHSDVKDSRRKSNAFSTKVSRFAPSAPGSTVFLPSSIEHNPGPGQYTGGQQIGAKVKASDASMRAHQSRLRQNESKSNTLLNIGKSGNSVPSVPRPEQSYGYQEQGQARHLVRQPPPNESYSGLGQDTVGPAAYNPR